MTQSSFGNQDAVAKALGVTPRRVRQLVADGVLPAAVKGRWRLDECRERYAAFKAPPDDPIWAEREARLVEDSVTAERLVDAALAEGASPKSLKPASLALQRLFYDWRFMVTCRSRTDSERALMRQHIELAERDAFAPLIARAFTLARSRPRAW